METIVVIKIGGNIIDDTKALTEFMSDFSAIRAPKILIHGGGKLATQLSRDLNIEPLIIGGRRVTDEKTIDIVTMVYGGLINKKIVAQLQGKKCNAIGFTGADANIIEAHKRINTEIDYGFAGDIDKVNADLLYDLLSKNYAPVIAPLTHDGNGNLLNTNADTMAAAIAIELSKVKKVSFIYCFEKEGLLKDVNNNESIISHLNIAEVEQLKEKQIINGGMLPKTANIIHALENGVEKVILCHAKNVLPIVNENAKFGTSFTKN